MEPIGLSPNKLYCSQLRFDRNNQHSIAAAADYVFGNRVCRLFDYLCTRPSWTLRRQHCRNLR